MPDGSQDPDLAAALAAGHPSARSAGTSASTSTDPDLQTALSASAPSGNPSAPSGALDTSWWGAVKGDLDIAGVVGSHALVDPFIGVGKLANRGLGWLGRKVGIEGSPGSFWWNSQAGTAQNLDTLEKTLTHEPWTAEGRYGLGEMGQVLGPIAKDVEQGAAYVLGSQNRANVAGEALQALPMGGVAKTIANAPRALARTAAAITAPARAATDWWRGMVERGQPSAEEIMGQAAQESPQSMGAAAAGVPMNQTSPEFQREVQNVYRRQGAVNPDATARQAEAESIGTRLTEGQALQDPDRMSTELNGRARNPEVRDLIGKQNQDLKNYQQRLRDEIADNNGVSATNQVDHGEALIGGYNDLNDAARGVVDTNYGKLRDAYAQYLEGGGQEMAIDAKTLLGNVQEALKKGIVDPQTGKRLGGMLTNHANTGIMKDLQDAADAGGMSFEDYEALRTHLATLMRGSSNPLERASSHVIRSAMEDMPLAQDIQELKGFADTARASARSYFQRVEADPAWKAVVDGTVTPDKFVKTFITGPNATREGVATMLQNFATNPTMRAQMTVAALDHLKEASGVDWQGNGIFRQAGFNKALNALDPKSASLFSPAMREGLQRLGNVAGNMQRQLPGSYVNNSNTWTAAAGEFARGGIEALANAKTGGLASIPFNAFRENARARAAARIVRPGAGIDVLEEPKPWTPPRPLEAGVGEPPQPPAPLSPLSPPSWGGPRPGPSRGGPSSPNGGAAPSGAPSGPGGVPPPLRQLPAPARPSGGGAGPTPAPGVGAAPTRFPSGMPPPPPASEAAQAIAKMRGAGAAAPPSPPVPAALTQAAPAAKFTQGSFRPLQPAPPGFDPNNIPDVTKMSGRETTVAAKSQADQMLAAHGLEQAKDTALESWRYYSHDGFLAKVQGDSATAKLLNAKADYWSKVHDRLTTIREKYWAKGEPLPGPQAPNK